MKSILGASGATEFPMWLETYLAEGEKNAQIYTLCNQKKFSPVQILRNLMEFFKKDSSPSAPRNVEIANEILADQARAYLEKKVSGEQLCRMVRTIESNCTDTEYPEGLGALWDACDWLSERPADELNQSLSAAAAAYIKHHRR